MAKSPRSVRRLSLFSVPRSRLALSKTHDKVRLLGLNLYQFSQCPQHRTWWRDDAGCSAKLPG